MKGGTRYAYFNHPTHENGEVSFVVELNNMKCKRKIEDVYLYTLLCNITNAIPGESSNTNPIQTITPPLLY